MSLAILIKLENNVISDIKISAGGVAEKPLILEKFSNLMIGKNLAKGIDLAVNNVDNIISPISDLTDIVTLYSISGFSSKSNIVALVENPKFNNGVISLSTC